MQVVVYLLLRSPYDSPASDIQRRKQDSLASHMLGMRCPKRWELGKIPEAIAEIPARFPAQVQMKDATTEVTMQLGSNCRTIRPILIQSTPLFQLLVVKK